MGIDKILRPKTSKEIDETIANLLAKTPNLPEFLRDHELFKYVKIVKAYDHIATRLLKESPEDVFMIHSSNPLFKMIKEKLQSYDFLNQPIKNIRFIGGPFTHALVKKESKVAELYGGIGSAVMIGLDHIIEIINKRNI